MSDPRTPRQKRDGVRVRLNVTQDEDGGVTVGDPQSGLVLSIIPSHPASNGPRTLLVEAYTWGAEQAVEAHVTPVDLLRIKSNRVVSFTSRPRQEDE